MASFELPPAPPAAYLSWLAFAREVEQKMGERPSLRDAATVAGAPFMGDDVSQAISQVLVPAIVGKARAALESGEKTVVPVLEIEPKLALKVADYVRRRAAFLTPKVCTAMGVEPLEPELSRLRDAVLRAIEERAAELNP